MFGSVVSYSTIVDWFDMPSGVQNSRVDFGATDRAAVQAAVIGSGEIILDFSINRLVRSKLATYGQGRVSQIEGPIRTQGELFETMFGTGNNHYYMELCVTTGAAYFVIFNRRIDNGQAQNIANATQCRIRTLA